jgi:very-short-patch-repair endonuclease
MGLEARAEVQVGRYSLDVLVEEVWCGFEADGGATHAGQKKRQRDADRDGWILDNARIPVLRITEDELKPLTWYETEQRILEFIEQHSSDVEERK